MVGEKPEKGGKWKMKNNCDLSASIEKLKI